MASKPSAKTPRNMQDVVENLNLSPKAGSRSQTVVLLLMWTCTSCLISPASTGGCELGTKIEGSAVHEAIR